jgi:hypothetical protein
MRTILALTIGGATLFGAASLANAQDCVGGYMMLKDQIPVRCDVGPGFGPMGATPLQPVPEGVASASVGGGNADEIPTNATEPVYTGSINTAGATVPPGGGNADEIPSSGSMNFVDSRDDCRPGYWYMQDMQSMNRPERCP